MSAALSIREQRRQRANVSVAEFKVEGQRHFAEKSAALQSAVSSHREVTALTSHQAEWRAQQKRLSAQRQRCEAELQAALQALAVNSYDAQHDSSAVDIHQLSRDMQCQLEEARATDAARTEWGRLMTGPRLKAVGLLRDLRRLAQVDAKETRLARERREDSLVSTRALLRSLMKGLQHQSAEFGRELEQAEGGLQAELVGCNAQWLERMEEDDALAPWVGDDGAAALPVNPHWLAGLPPEQQAEVGAERQRWSALWAERVDMEGRRHQHRLDHVHAALQAATAALTVQRRAEWEELEDEAEEKKQPDDAERVRAEAEAGSKPLGAAGRRGSAKSRLAVKGSRMAAPPAWSLSHERRLRYLHREYSAAGKQRAALMERLEMDFPAFPLAELRQRVDLLVHLRFHAEQRAIERAQHKRNKDDIAQTVLSGWTAAVEKLKEQWAAREEQRLRDAGLADKHAELEEQRLAKQLRDDQAAVEAEAVKAAAAEAAAVRAAAESARREEEHARLRDYEAAQAVERAKVQRLVDAERQRLASEAAEEAPHHSERVAVREQLRLDKAASQRQAAEERAAAQRQREAQLQALAESVAPVVLPSAERLMAPTAASAAADASSEALFRVDGYSNEQVFSDPRAKLAVALHQAGIAPSHDYAREVLLSTAAAKATRRDVRSTLTLGADE